MIGRIFIKGLRGTMDHKRQWERLDRRTKLGSVGKAAVGLAGIAVMASPWGRNGAERDIEWLEDSPAGRWRNDMDNLTVSGDKYGKIKDILLVREGSD